MLFIVCFEKIKCGFVKVQIILEVGNGYKMVQFRSAAAEILRLGD